MTYASPYFKRVLTVALVWRAWFAFGLSYIHPDEYLQGPQVAAHELFGFAAQTPWEFNTEKPIRSFVPLWLFYGIPLGLVPEAVHPQVALYGLRALIALTTWVFGDMAIDRLAESRSNPMTGLLVSATSYVTWTYQSHTFSNSFETILVLWFLVIVHEFDHTFRDPIDKHTDCFLLGLIAALGIFNRPTFLFWIFIPSFNLLRFWWGHPWSFSTFALSFSLFVGICIYVDTFVYDSPEWVIAPLNNLLYNSQPGNLALHGSHPWYQHIFVNLPQLLGPALVLVRPIWNLPMRAAVGGLFMLSLVPHQEARFLLPIVPLLCCTMETTGLSTRLRLFVTGLWLLFNTIMGFVMGTLHQGGVIPAQTWLGENALGNAQRANIVWWKTYTPPLWFLNQPSSTVHYASAQDSYATIFGVLSLQDMGAASNVSGLVDLMGSGPEVVAQVLADAGSPLYFVAPFASKHKQFTEGKPLVWSTKTHATLELLDLQDLSTLQPGLGIWLL